MIWFQRGQASPAGSGDTENPQNPENPSLQPPVGCVFGAVFRSFRRANLLGVMMRGEQRIVEFSKLSSGLWTPVNRIYSRHSIHKTDAGERRQRLREEVDKRGSSAGSEEEIHGVCGE
jgi:hypothetical protein